MTRKILNLGDTGDSIHWGTDDADYINKYLTGVDQSGADLVTISTLTTFHNTIFRITNPAESFRYILNSSAISANRNITLPLLAADDIFTFNNATQVLTNKDLTSGTNTLPTSAFTASSTDTLLNKTESIDLNILKHSTTNVAGDIYKSDGTRMIRFPKGTANQVLTTNAGATDIVWATLAGAATQTKGKASFNGTGSATTFLVAHAIGGIPSYANVTPASSAANLGTIYPGDLEGAQYWITVDATNITIHFGKAPAIGTNNVVFFWQAYA